jgi:hypothetical protein
MSFPFWSFSNEGNEGLVGVEGVILGLDMRSEADEFLMGMFLRVTGVSSSRKASRRDFESAADSVDVFRLVDLELGVECSILRFPERGEEGGVPY